MFTSDESQHGSFVDAADPLFFIEPDRTVERTRVLHFTTAGLHLENTSQYFYSCVLKLHRVTQSRRDPDCWTLGPDMKAAPSKYFLLFGHPGVKSNYIY